MKATFISLSKGAVLLFVLFCFFSCKKKNIEPKKQENPKSISFKFQAKANGMDDFMNGMIMFQNAYGNKFGVTNLRYIVSEIKLHKTDGSVYHIGGYHLVNINEESTLTYSPTSKIPAGSYDSISIVLGLTPKNNKSFSHPDLNALDWNWPNMMGGGYHMMQLEGDFINNNNDTVKYQTHIGASINPNNPADTLSNSILFQFYKKFTVSKNSTHVSIDVIMHVDQWYKNPNTIDLNVNGTAIMGDYNAQKLFHQNGENGVLSIGNVIVN